VAAEGGSSPRQANVTARSETRYRSGAFVSEPAEAGDDINDRSDKLGACPSNSANA